MYACTYTLYAYTAFSSPGIYLSLDVAVLVVSRGEAKHEAPAEP